MLATGGKGVVEEINTTRTRFTGGEGGFSTSELEAGVEVAAAVTVEKRVGDDRWRGRGIAPIAISGGGPPSPPNRLSPSTTPVPTSQSPAALFLSAFSSPPSSRIKPLPNPDSEGSVVSGFTLGKIIGYGGFSIIRLASSSSGGTAAVKIVRRADILKQDNPEKSKRRLEREASTWASLNHEHILPLFQFISTPYADFFFTIYCPAGTLYDILKRDGTPALPQDDVGMMFRQVVRGLRYLHGFERTGLVHGDIKLENVLVEESGVCRIGDFGMTRKVGECYSDDEDSSSEDEEEDGEETLSTPGTHLHLAATLSVSAGPSARRPSTPAMSTTTTGSNHLTAHHPSLLLRHHTQRTPRSHRAASGNYFQAAVAKMKSHWQGPPGSLPYAAPELLTHNPNQPHASSSSSVHTLSGRPGHQAPGNDDSKPTYQHQQQHRYHPSPAQDIWALGILLHTLLTGRLPFSDSFEPRLVIKILHSPYILPQSIGHGAEQVLLGCLSREVDERWTIEMVDDVAWGVGWGDSEEEEEEEQDVDENNHVVVVASPLSGTLDSPSSPSQRRSLSSARRSASRASRAPVLTDPGTSTTRRRIASRSRSDEGAGRGRGGATSASSSLCSPLIVRGRRPRQSPSGSAGDAEAEAEFSRSPSPSVLPSTPPDALGGHPRRGAIGIAGIGGVEGLPEVSELDGGVGLLEPLGVGVSFAEEEGKEYAVRGRGMGRVYSTK